MIYSRDQILAARLPTIEVPVPEWGPGAIALVQQMSVNTRIIYLERCRLESRALLAWEDDQEAPVCDRKGVAKPAHFDQAIFAITLSLVDEARAFVFDEADMALFGQMSETSIVRVWNAIQEINDFNRFSGEAVTAEKKG